MKTLIDRSQIAQATHDRFQGKTFDWGAADCIQMMKFAAMKAGRPNPLKGVADYRGETGAVLALRRALKAAKLPKDATLVELIDKAGFTRLESAAHALPGDLLGLMAEEGSPWGVAVAIAMGNGKALAFALDPETGTHRAFVGEALLKQNGICPAVTAWSLF